MNNLMKRLAALAAGIFLLCMFIIPPAVFAQAPDIGDVLKGATPPPAETPAKKEAPAAPVIIQEEEKPFTLPEGEKIFVKDFKLEGADPGDETAVAALLEPYRNRELSMTEMTEAANKLTLFYRNKGYMVAKAYVPKQDASGGILTIRIILGKYGQFSLTNDSPVQDWLVRGVFEKIRDTSPVVRRDGLERAMLLVKDMPGCAIPTVTIAPGAVPETTDFDVKAEAGERINGYIMGDNQGSRYTGRNRLYGGIDVNSPFTLADKFSLSGMTSEYEGLQNIRASYGFPLAYNGLRAELAASRTQYELGGPYSALDATGSADIFEGTISYPVKRSRDDSIDLFLNLAYKDLEDDLEEVDSENPRNVAVATLTLQRTKYGTLFSRNFFAVVAGSVNLGSLDIEDRQQRILNKAGADTDGTFSKLNLNFSGELSLTEKFSLRGSLKLQKVLTGNNLDSTEQLFITGPGGVRVYDVSYGFDNGYLLNGELRYALPDVLGVKHTLGLFADNGWVCAEDGDYAEDDEIMLSDAGLGYYAGYKQFFGSVHLVHSLGNSSSVDDDPGTRVLVQGGISF